MIEIIINGMVSVFDDFDEAIAYMQSTQYEFEAKADYLTGDEYE